MHPKGFFYFNLSVNIFPQMAFHFDNNNLILNAHYFFLLQCV